MALLVRRNDDLQGRLVEDRPCRPQREVLRVDRILHGQVLRSRAGFVVGLARRHLVGAEEQLQPVGAVRIGRRVAHGRAALLDGIDRSPGDRVVVVRIGDMAAHDRRRRQPEQDAEAGRWDHGLVERILERVSASGIFDANRRGIALLARGAADVCVLRQDSPVGIQRDLEVHPVGEVAEEGDVAPFDGEGAGWRAIGLGPHAGRTVHEQVIPEGVDGIVRWIAAGDRVVEEVTEPLRRVERDVTVRADVGGRIAVLVEVECEGQGDRHHVVVPAQRQWRRGIDVVQWLQHAEVAEVVVPQWQAEVEGGVARERQMLSLGIIAPPRLRFDVVLPVGHRRKAVMASSIGGGRRDWRAKDGHGAVGDAVALVISYRAG